MLSEKRVSNCAIARQLGVTEGTVRYHLRREGTPDGRANKVFKAEELSEVIEHWREWRSEVARPINVKELHDHLEREFGYGTVPRIRDGTTYTLPHLLAVSPVERRPRRVRPHVA